MLITKTIKLTRGKVALLDEEDWEYCCQFKWHAIRSRNLWFAEGRIEGKDVRLHRELLSAEPGDEVDHKNGDGLDNRRCNLRFCSHPQNSANRRRQSNNKSGCKGVSYNTKKEKWVAFIAFNGGRFYIGYYATKREAALAYNIAAREFHGEFARVNNLDKGQGYTTGGATLGDVLLPRPAGIDKRLARIRQKLAHL